MEKLDLRRFRFDNGLKQHEIAEILEMTQANFSRIEKEGLFLSKERIEKLKNAFPDVDLDKYVLEYDIYDDGNVIGVQLENNKNLITIVNKQNYLIGQLSNSLLELSTRTIQLYEKLVALIETKF